MEKKARFKEGDTIWTIIRNKIVPMTVYTVVFGCPFVSYSIKERIVDNNKNFPIHVDECDSFSSRQEIIDQL